MMVPSIASLRSLRVTLTIMITLCILSISCFRKIFKGCNRPIFFKRSFTYKTLLLSNFRTYTLQSRQTPMSMIKTCCIQYYSCTITMCAYNVFYPEENCCLASWSNKTNQLCNFVKTKNWMVEKHVLNKLCKQLITLFYIYWFVWIV